MADLLIVGVVVTVILLYLADRAIKARAQARRLQELNERLDAAAAEQQAERHAAARASDALTNVMPAIKRPPLSLPGLAPHEQPNHGQPNHGPVRAKPGCERPARRGGRTGDHPARPSQRSGA